MHKTVILGMVCTIAGCLACAMAMDEGTQAFNAARPSVVTIIRDGGITGSGVIVGKNRVVTNLHVADGLREGSIKTHDGKSWNITSVLTSNETADLALLDVANLDAPAIVYAPTDSLAVGQKVWAIGSPLGLEETLTEGIISAFRNLDTKSRLSGMIGAGDAHVPGWVQTSAAISPGNSGGALVDRQGRLIGITTWGMRRGQNLNMAVHVDLVSAFVGNPTGFSRILPKGPSETETLDARIAKTRSLAIHVKSFVLRMAVLYEGSPGSVDRAIQDGIRLVRDVLRDNDSTGSIKKTFSMLRAQAKQRIPECISILSDKDILILSLADDGRAELDACASIVAEDRLALAAKVESTGDIKGALDVLREKSLNDAVDGYTASATITTAITGIQSRLAIAQLNALSTRTASAKGNLFALKEILAESERIPKYDTPAYLAASKAVADTITSALAPLVNEYNSAMETATAVIDGHQWNLLNAARAGLLRIDAIGGTRLVPPSIRERLGSADPWVVKTETIDGIRIHRITFGLATQMEFIRLPSGVLLGRTEITNDAEQAIMERRGGDPSTGQNPWTTEDQKQVIILIRQMSKLSGLSIRAPTHAEIAVASGVTLPILDPDDIQRIQKTSWNLRTAKSVLHAVGTATVNPLGFHDVIGNAAEIIRDANGPYMTCGGSVRESISGIGDPVEWERSKGPIGLRVVVVGPGSE